MTIRLLLMAYAVIASVHLAGQYLSEPVADITQVLLMPVLALSLLAGGPRSRLTDIVLVALGFSWLGDLLPRFLDGDAAFLAMIGFFLLAQVSYIVAFRPQAHRSVLRRGWHRWAPYAVAFVVLVAACAPGAGVLAPAVIGYGACLVTMAMLATGLNRLTTVGALVFVLSDSLIALDAFVPGFGLNESSQDATVMATYVLAQLLLVLGARKFSRTVGGSSLSGSLDLGAGARGLEDSTP